MAASGGGGGRRRAARDGQRGIGGPPPVRTAGSKLALTEDLVHDDFRISTAPRRRQISPREAIGGRAVVTIDRRSRCRRPDVGCYNRGMASAAFDTLAAARKLESAGMDRNQAEAVAGVIRAGQGELATKSDLAALQQELAGQRRDLAGLRWMIAINMAITLATLAAVLQGLV
ncbi:MAG: hypothetical protein OXF27_13000 [Acidobacteria bacterium]|nr:hypothetical protein [Acidobacteriota bacterium]